MPLSLLDSQLATIEEPSPDEDAWVGEISQAPHQLVAAFLARCATTASPSSDRPLT